MVDITGLEEKLDGLDGYDFEAVEKEERAAGNDAPSVYTSPTFICRVAARALKVNPHDLKTMPIRKYSRMLLRVSRFLFADSDEEETPSKESEV